MSDPLPQKPLSPPIPSNETERLAALHRYKILDTPPEAAFDRITKLAARLFDMPISLISLVDTSRAWFKSCVGFGANEVPRDKTLCSFAVLTDKPLIVPDARLDDRFTCNPFVQSEPGVRFYAGAPLLSRDGFNLGTLCLLDSQPRASLTTEQQATLVDLAAMVVDELELRLAAHQIAQVDAALLEVMQGVSTVIGHAFFPALVQHLTKALGMSYACISLLVNEHPEALETIAFCAQGQIIDNMEYGLQDTPSLEVIQQQKLCYYPQGIQALFPKDHVLASLSVESYAAIPFFDSAGKPLGLLSVMDGKPLENLQLVQSLLTIFAVRIAAELERQQAAERLQLYADIVRDTQVGMVVWQLEDLNDPGSFRLLIANPAASESTGFNFEPLIGRTMAERFPMLLQTPLVHQYMEVVRSGQALDFGEVSYGEDGITAGIYSLKAFPLPNRCLGLAFENITARKRIEIQLQESQRYSQQIAEAMPGILFVHDLIEQRNVYTNRQIADFLGYTSEQVQAMGADAIPTLIHPDDLEKVLKYFESFRSAPEGTVLGIEYQARHASGEWRWLYSQSVVFNRTTEALPHQILGISLDISDRKWAEEQLRRAAKLDAFRLSLADALRPLADPVEVQATASRVLGEYLGANRVAYFEVRGAGYVVERDYVNGAAALTGGYSMDSFGPKLLTAYRAGRTVSIPDVATDPHLSSEERSAYAAIQIGAYVGIPLLKEGEFVAGLAVHASESRVWTPDEVSLVEEVAESTWAAVERARAEAALRESENRLRLALKSAQLGAWDFNPMTDVLQWDEQCKAMFGVSPTADINYEIFLAGLHPEDRDRTNQVVQYSLNPESGGEYDIEFRTIGIEDGVERWIAAKGKAFFSPAGIAIRFIGTVLNITNVKRAEAEREQLLEREQAARETAERANRIKDEFLAVLSHELRSPLNPILGWSKLLQQGKLDETRQREALATIERNAKLQTQLIDDLLDISRIMQGKLSLTVTPVSLTFVITAAVETVQLAAEAKNIQILLDLATATSLVSGDAARLQQVVWNLLTNAVKFTPNGGQVTIELRQLDQLAQICVTDTGKGIDPQFLPHVFEYFRQADATTTRKFGGLGLGLAIVRQIVEMHGGTVWAESEGENQGATFTVQLPLNLQARSIEPESPHDGTLAETPLGNLQILLVDDDADTREFQAFLLEQSGAKVTAVASGVEALQALDRFIPHVLVSDVGMAEMDGYMLIRQIRSRPHNKGSNLPAIALTAYARDLDRQQLLQAGFQQHLAKPVEPEVLVREIAKLLKHN
ncbi:MAG: PAS domain-containing protein [Drouetiella hepatica Uher 2000/2452]|jgi:PAS domain S-box-containing protein|uniref:Circadian input-output histidine kinase CikA n=1 Tax=Drouetiella hepatica Uher 2000/2452 TaxID=904376 RepID=A0A951QGX4_9CYAN|nr:PAS domain-containing protein [Drouetiella hepatica Uher 2000/2452]